MKGQHDHDDHYYTKAEVDALIEGLPPETPPPVEPPLPTDITINSGESIQAAVDNNPTGTSFFVKSGEHLNQTVNPKTGNRFTGQPGTIMDGGEVTEWAFLPTADDVTIEGLEIRNYAGPPQLGAVLTARDDPTVAPSGWLVDNCDIHHNTMGLRTGNDTTVRDCQIHHNYQINLGGNGAVILIENNLIHDGNYQDDYEPGWEAGGFKFFNSDGLIVRGNTIYDNHGPGAWTDTDNTDTLYENNEIYGNTEGIFHEAANDIVIRNNNIHDNGEAGHWGYQSGILIAHSGPSLIHDNILTNNGNGIIGMQQARNDLGVVRIFDNMEVRDNTINGSLQLQAGVVQDGGDVTVFDRNITFEGNTYDGGTFAWLNADRTFAEWQSYGFDPPEEIDA